MCPPFFNEKVIKCFNYIALLGDLSQKNQLFCIIFFQYIFTIILQCWKSL